MNRLLPASIACVTSILALGALIGAAAAPVPRTILALYDSRVDRQVVWTPTHRLAEMPLNHLGLVVRYLDINQPLPQPETLSRVRGVLMWIDSGSMRDPIRFLAWAEKVVDAGKRFVILGDLAFERDLKGQTTPLGAVNRFLSKLSIRTDPDWSPITYNVSLVHQDPAMVGFERQIAGVLPPFERVTITDKRAHIHLTGRRNEDPETDSQLVVTSPAGGFVASGYTHYQDGDDSKRQWILNPFEFFRQAFATDEIPKPDITTLCGRRIFYSHIDGDGWRNITEIRHRGQARVLSAEIILRRVLEVFTDLPVTVAPVAGDIDPEWFGTVESSSVARRMFSLPQVEAGSHTYSHPFDWQFFADGNREKERPFLKLYPRHWGQFEAPSFSRFFSAWSPFSLLFAGETVDDASAEGSGEAGVAPGGYDTPRAYAIRPFDLDLEIRGSVAFIQRLLPSGKKVKIVQWSGTTLPFEAAVKAVRVLGLKNINGGDTRFDREFPSYAWVAPIGLQVGSERQIYASNSNENTYTDLWRDRYFGFIYLVRTFQNTDSPWRLSPLNVYYHMYSGQKLSSLNAVIANLKYVRKQEITPITTSHYAGIAEGFYSTVLRPSGHRRWSVEDRGELQTIRFDHATFEAVDFSRSSGVIGQRHYQGSLYVALDPSATTPVVALKGHPHPDRLADAIQPYLVQSRWPVSNLQVIPTGFGFRARGFGPGQMAWKVPGGGSFEVTQLPTLSTRSKTRVAATPGGLLQLTLDPVRDSLIEVRVTRMGEAR
ncbi:MAG: hypothetical protein ACE5JX_07035 [Acidobacteriota bacterium]